VNDDTTAFLATHTRTQSQTLHVQLYVSFWAHVNLTSLKLKLKQPENSCPDLSRRRHVLKAVVPYENKIILKNFKMF